MKTKAEIVQKLLEEKKIDAEDAIILLMGNEKETQFIPYPQPYPIYPVSPSPYYPTLPSWPIITYMSSSSQLLTGTQFRLT